MGGMQGFGRVEPEPNEPVFHQPWEGRLIPLYRAMGFARRWTIDGGRAMIESLPPIVYLSASYYAKWLMGLEKSVERAGLVGADEIELVLAAPRRFRQQKQRTGLSTNSNIRLVQRQQVAPETGNALLLRSHKRSLIRHRL